MKNESITERAVCYLADNAADPFQRYILRKEILKLPDCDSVTDTIRLSKWYRQLAEEQWDDGSYGRFHTMDTSAAKGRAFTTTEAAFRRMHDLGLTKSDPLAAKSIGLMERYLRGEETWRDNVEAHGDGGKSHMRFRLFAVAADLNLFDPLNPAIEPFREVCVNQLREAFASGGYNDDIWQRFNKDYTGTSFQVFMAYPLRLVQGGNALDKVTERNYLNYIWNRSEGIYYISNSAIARKLSLEDKGFTAWLYALETLGGFSLFDEFLCRDIYGHLQSETDCLLKDDYKLPPSQPIIGHYAESGRDKNSRKTDMMLRILRITKRIADSH